MRKEDLLNAPTPVLLLLAERTNFLAGWRNELQCSTCGHELSVYDRKHVNVLDCSVNCGHPEDIGEQETPWITKNCYVIFSDG